MIGLVLVTHGNLALEFISAMQHVVGKQEQVEAVCIGPEDDMEMRREEILKKSRRSQQRQRYNRFNRHVRRNAFQSGNFHYGQSSGGDYCRN